MRRYSLILVLLVIPLTACGGNGSGGGGGGTQAEPVGDQPAADQPAGDIDVGECIGAANALASAISAAGQAISGVASGLEESVQTLDAFAESAPEEIAEDLKTVAEGYASVAQAVEEADFDAASGETPSAQEVAAIQAASEALNEQGFRDAVQRVDTWFREECSA
jgi:hypothetical protein